MSIIGYLLISVIVFLLMTVGSAMLLRRYRLGDYDEEDIITVLFLIAVLSLGWIILLPITVLMILFFLCAKAITGWLNK